MIPYGRQSISEDDIQSVVDVLRSDFLTQGPMVPKFEEAVARAVGAKRAIAVTNATAALHLACLALELGPGDLLWTSPNSFVASANCGRYCGADVDFVDIDQATGNISIVALSQKLADAKRRGRLPKVLIPVHFAGHSCDMQSIKRLANEYHFKIVEDASHAIGGRYRNSMVGNCSYSDLTVFSFHPVKIVTTGEGGMITTNDSELAGKIALLRSHGITRDEKRMRGSNHGPWYYQQLALGFNYRLTELQAALGLSQLKRLDEFVARRNWLADRYDRALSYLPVGLPKREHDVYSAFHLYVIRLDPTKIKKDHLQVFCELRNAGIGVNLHYIPIHTQPYYKDLGFKEGDFPEAEMYYSKAISIPMYYGLEDEHQDQVVDILTRVIQ